MGRKTVGVLLAIALLALSPAGTARSQTAPGTEQAPTVMMVIDTSGSMAGSRLTQAKEALNSAVGALAPGQPAGLRSYAGNCGNRGTLRVPIGADNRDQLRSQISALSAGGGTPTPDALLGGASDLAGVTGPRTIILVSDGESTCGDPCPTAESIKRDQGIDFKVHTVGFQTSAPASGELACIARVTGGQYFPVDDAEGLADAINSVIGGGAEKFVYLALGDSYQSGEGVANSLAGTQDYLTRGYENGSNYPESVGAQQNTYTADLGGDSCHRALANYAKLNRDRLKPGAPVVLVDMTCSGADIQPDGPFQPGDKRPIIGTVGSARPDPASQLAEGIRRLQAIGLTAADVDLVTTGMGGNDAKFGEIVAACVLPNLIRELLRAYPDPPGEIELIGKFVTCERLDDLKFHTDEAIKALPPKEVWAQGQILAAFPTARVLQVNYPNSLPAQKQAPATCGGIRKDDLDFARKKIAQIDDAIERSIQTSGRVELVDVETAFGPNALCPSDPSAALANGINQANLKAELQRLLNINGNGDAETRRRVDTLVRDYNEWKRCAKVHYIPFGEDCDVSAAFDRMKASALAAVERLDAIQPNIFANLMAPPGSTTEDFRIRFDRSRGLFHPNAAGHAVMACRVLAVYGGSGCPGARAPVAGQATADTLSGQRVGNAPLNVLLGTVVPLVFGGFRPGSPVTISLFSAPVVLGSAVADDAGVVRTSVTMPAVGAGVHILELQGTAGGGVDLTKQALVRYPGRPQGGDSYATYFCCFAPEPTNITVEYEEEHLDVIYLGEVLATVVPDEDGGVLVEVPLVDPLTRPDGLDIQVRSQRTGKTLTERVEPVPSVAGLWATNSGAGALSITGALTSVNGRVHSEGDLTLTGVLLTLTGGVEYVGNLTQFSFLSTVDPPAVKVEAGGSPVVRTIEEFRPGSKEAVAAGAAYTAISSSECRQGVWRPAPGRALSGIVYVPCAVEIVAGNSQIRALIAAEGTIGITGQSVRVEPDRPGLPALVSGARGDAAVRLTGANLTVNGTLFAPDGGVQFIGLGGTFRCGAVADTIRVLGSGNRFVIDEACLRD